MLTDNFPILSLLIFFPLFGAFIIALFARDENSNNARNTALWTSIITFIISLVAYSLYDGSNANFQLVEKHVWIAAYDISYHLGVDGISIFFILLTTFLIPICVLVSWDNISKLNKEFFICFLLLEAFVIGSFAALDIVLFYIFFEGMLIPMYLIIGIWGGENRVYAAFKFFLYTLLGSVLFLIAILFIVNTFGTASIPDLMDKVPSLALDVQKWLFIALFASFAVKVPMWPVHTWLPDAHVQAPTAGSVILAGILLKLGGYGYLRFSLPMLPEASLFFADYIFALSVIAVIYTSLIALVQADMKKLIAYSSVAHMGFVTAGTFAFTQAGIEGAIFQMISHGLVSAALFICVGVIYDRMHTKEIAKYGGVVQTMPAYAAFFMFFTMASVGLPSTSGFVGEFLVMLGVFQANPYVAALIATGVILGAGYALWLYRRICFGEIKNAEVKELLDLSPREWLVFVPLVGLVILLGIYPEILLGDLRASIEHLLTQIPDGRLDMVVQPAQELGNGF